VAGASAAAGQTSAQLTSDGCDLTAASWCAGNGRVPFVLKIGVTGHRRLANLARTAEAVTEAVRLIRGLIPKGTHEVVVVAISALAEGADRIVVRELLSEPGSRLHVALPLPPGEYARDFETAASKEEFDTLLTQASHVWQAPELPDREAAYEQAGWYVIDECDVLIALWDGEPSRGRGGTAEIVARAREQGVPLVWIRTSGEPTVVREFDGERIKMLREAARDLNEYNSGLIPDTLFTAQAHFQLGSLGLTTDTRPFDGPLNHACEQVAGWLVPFFVRADVLALRLQGRFRLLSTAMFAMAAAAVSVVAIQASFWPGQNWVAGFEVLLLLLLLGIPLFGNRSRLYERWTAYRFLAERLRSAYFLALTGTGDRIQRAGSQASFSDPSVAWIERALAEVMAGRPRLELDACDVQQLRGYLSGYWIGGQVSYHVKAAERHREWDTRLRRTTAALFGITLICAVLHLLGVADDGARPSSLAALLIVLAICVPAVGAAVHGIETQRQYRRHSQRFSRMVTLLKQLARRMDEAEDLQQVQLIAANVEQVMREESNDWFGVMRFHDIELIT